MCTFSLNSCMAVLLEDFLCLKDVSKKCLKIPKGVNLCDKLKKERGNTMADRKIAKGQIMMYEKHYTEKTRGKHRYFGRVNIS